MDLRTQRSLMHAVIRDTEADLRLLETLRESVVNLAGVIRDAITELDDKQYRARIEAYEVQTMIRAAK